MTNYKETIESFFLDYEQRNWDAKPVERAMDFVIGHPEQVELLLEIALTRSGEPATFTEDALSFIDKEAFDRLLAKSLELLGNAPTHTHTMAESVIGRCSFQFLDLLHPYLTQLFELDLNSSGYFENYPWRDSGSIHLEYLRAVLNASNHSSYAWRKAWNCLLETRASEPLQEAIRQSENVLSPTSVKKSVRGVGFALEDKTFRPLTSQAIFHLAFAPDFPVDRQWWCKIHPTWHFATEGQLQATFGGRSSSICPACNGALHRLLVLRPVPNGVGVTSLTNLELACCLSCLGWEQAPLFYQHDKAGVPTSIAYESRAITPQFITGPLLEASVAIVKTPTRWRWQDWAYANGRENLNRIGGSPSWIQFAEYPNCPHCQRLMPFLFQMDSDLPTKDGRYWLWGSGGIGYAFWCDECKVSAYLWQCT